MLLQHGEHINERRCGGRLVAVHLRPHENLQRPAAPFDLVDLAVGIRESDLIEPYAELLEAVEIPFYVRMPSVGRENI